MDAHIAEVVTEVRLKKFLCLGVQGLSAARKAGVDSDETSPKFLRTFAVSITAWKSGAGANGMNGMRLNATPWAVGQTSKLRPADLSPRCSRSEGTTGAIFIIA